MEKNEKLYTNPADLRREYMKQSLELEDMLDDPIEQFDKWFLEAIDADIPDPNAMTLATLDANNIPSGRIVLLKGVDRRGFVFYTNYTSDKAKDLGINSQCSLLFYWGELERQIRIVGSAQKVPSEESESYFHSRPRASQIGAWASLQSSEMESDLDMKQRFEKYEKKFQDLEQIPYPEFWGGYVIQPSQFEFWQGRPSRMHDRIVYKKKEDSWTLKRLYP